MTLQINQIVFTKPGKNTTDVGSDNVNDQLELS